MPSASGYSIAMHAASLDEHEYPNGTAWHVVARAALAHNLLSIGQELSIAS